VDPGANRECEKMKLKPPSFLILGMVRLGATSGYAIKQAVDRSTRFFAPTSLAQVYPELARLDRAGLLRRHEDPRGAVARSAYELTSEGEQELIAWLRSPRHAPTEFRDEGLLRLFFADALSSEDQLELLARLRERAREAGGHIREEILPVAQALAAEGTRCPALVARLGADTHAYVERWLARVERELREAAPSGGGISCVSAAAASQPDSGRPRS
jgi:DNA-binding PadR family transcriptional regulator